MRLTGYDVERLGHRRRGTLAGQGGDRYPVINDPVLGLITDIKHPFMGSDQITYDSWLNYQCKIFNGRIGWKIQLNIRNLLNDNLLIPVKANPVTIGDLKTRDIAAYRIGEARNWQLTSTFSF